MDLMPLSSRRLQREGGEMRAVGLAEPQHPSERAGGCKTPRLAVSYTTMQHRGNLPPVVRTFSIRERCHR